jgi:hypothetical protein
MDCWQIKSSMCAPCDHFLHSAIQDREKHYEKHPPVARYMNTRYSWHSPLHRNNRRHRRTTGCICPNSRNILCHHCTHKRVWPAPHCWWEPVVGCCPRFRSDRKEVGAIVDCDAPKHEMPRIHSWTSSETPYLAASLVVCKQTNSRFGWVLQ